MAYQSWSVVFGEQPSAAKWNILGTNDAAFNDGSGFPNTIGSDALVAAQTDSTPGSIADVGTGYSTGATMSVPAGTWFFLAKSNGNVSSTTRVKYTSEIYNSTGAAILDSTDGETEFTSGTMNASIPMTNACITTLSTTSTVIARFKVDDATGTAAIANVKLIAIPVGA